MLFLASCGGQAPNITVPQVSLPTVSLPTVSLPTVTLPDWLMLPFLTSGRSSSGNIVTGNGGNQAQAAVTLSPGQTWQFRATVNGQNVASGELLWSSTQPGVASVNAGGLVTALTVGTTTVRATLASTPATFLDFPVVVTANTVARTAPGAGSAPASAFAQRVLDLTNAARTAGHTCGPTAYPPVAPLTYNAKLEQSAQAHADDMAGKNYFSHTSQDGRTFSQRISATGYSWSLVGENIAAGYPTPETVVESWLTSEGHCQDIMNANFRELGVGYAVNAASTYQNYWVQDFGTP